MDATERFPTETLIHIAPHPVGPRSAGATHFYQRAVFASQPPLFLQLSTYTRSASQADPTQFTGLGRVAFARQPPASGRKFSIRAASFSIFRGLILMDSIWPIRKRLDHEVPGWAQAPEFFITICCQKRNENQLCRPEVAEAVFDSAKKLSHLQLWDCELLLLMPDHLHLLVGFLLAKKCLRLSRDGSVGWLGSVI